MSTRERWRTRAGFIVAAVGSAVGLGNIWQFPFKTATNGGAAFLVVYLVSALAIGFPAMLAEFVIGRRTHRNVVDAFERLGHPAWRAAGVLALGIGVWVLSYYSVVGGWIVRYFLGSVTGAYFGDPGAYFGTVSAGLDALTLHVVFMTVTAGIVALGVAEGIERATRVMVPGIVVLLVGLAVWAGTLDGAGAAYDYFLSPEPAEFVENFWSLLPFAVSQAFFSLSLGMGIMITYSSYVGEDTNLGVDGVAITVTNTAIGVLAGLVVFPILFAENVDPATSGSDALFVATASAFAALPLGRVFGVVFFGVVLVAALSSAISLLEVSVSYVVDNTDYGRSTATAGVAGAILVLGIPSALDTAWLGWFDGLAYGVLLPVSVLLILTFVGWVIGPVAVREIREVGGARAAGRGAGSDSDSRAARRERSERRGNASGERSEPRVRGGRRTATAWLWLLRTVVLLAVLGALLAGVLELATTGTYVPPV